MDESGTVEGDCGKKAASGRRVFGGSRSLVRVLHKTLLVPVLMYGSETMKEEGYRVRAV